jgi:hypothetical protein
VDAVERVALRLAVVEQHDAVQRTAAHAPVLGIHQAPAAPPVRAARDHAGMLPPHAIVDPRHRLERRGLVEEAELGA